jgi:patatin-like phospholipase/acyl hydrolase
MMQPTNPIRARATSAAPTFFRPLVNGRTKEGYIDGAIFHNNPVRIANYESKLIWPDVEELHPDILLSIGTAHNGENTDGNPGSSVLDQRRAQDRKRLTKDRPKERKPPGLNPFSEVQSWINVMFKRMDDILDAESIWRDFRKDIITNSSAMEARRYQRLNPKVKSRTPKMDEKKRDQYTGRRSEGSIG